MLVVMSVYNEARVLPLALGHLPPDTRVLIVDGAYRDFEHAHPYSDDGTLEIARDFGATVIECREAWADQCVKRTATLIPGETVFVLDADEMLHTELPVLTDGVDVGWVTMTSPVYEDAFLSPRVFRVREGWHYAGRHHWVYDAENRLVASHTFAGTDYRHAILPVWVHNAKDLRPCDGREAAKNRYASIRSKRESRVKSEAALPQTA